jgi:hypothetical protein
MEEEDMEGIEMAPSETSDDQILRGGGGNNNMMMYHAK